MSYEFLSALPIVYEFSYTLVGQLLAPIAMCYFIWAQFAERIKVKLEKVILFIPSNHNPEDQSVTTKTVNSPCVPVFFINHGNVDVTVAGISFTNEIWFKIWFKQRFKNKKWFKKWFKKPNYLIPSLVMSGDQMNMLVRGVDITDPSTPGGGTRGIFPVTVPPRSTKTGWLSLDLFDGADIKEKGKIIVRLASGKIKTYKYDIREKE